MTGSAVTGEVSNCMRKRTEYVKHRKLNYGYLRDSTEKTEVGSCSEQFQNSCKPQTVVGIKYSTFSKWVNTEKKKDYKDFRKSNKNLNSQKEVEVMYIHDCVLMDYMSMGLCS